MENVFNITSSNSSISAALKSQKRIFFSQIAKWFYNNVNTDEDFNLDVADLVLLLQALGFKLRKFEKADSFSSTRDLKIEIQCGISNFEAILVHPCSNCKCPTPTSMAKKGGEFWEVTGLGPKTPKNSGNTFNETGSSLLPLISKERQFVIREILLLLFQTIHSPNEHKEVEVPEAKKGFFNREPSIDLLYPIKTPPTVTENDLMQMPPPNLASTPTRLIREKTWEIVPSIASSLPPVLSSPVPDLCLSVGQISVSGPKDTNNHLSSLLQEIHQKVAKALELVPHRPQSNSRLGTKTTVVTKRSHLESPLANVPKQVMRSMTLPRPKMPPNSNISMRSSDSIDITSRKRNSSAIPKVSSTSNRATLTSITKRDRPITAPPKPERQTLSARRRVSFDSKTPRPSFKNI